MRILLFTGKVGSGSPPSLPGPLHWLPPRGTARWCSRPTRRTRWPMPTGVRTARSVPSRRRSPTGSSSSRSTPSCASSSPGPTSSATCSRCSTSRASTRSRPRLTVIPGAEEVLALLELRLHRPVGRVGRDRGRLRSDRRDAAAARAARGTGLVHAPGVPGRAAGREGAPAGAEPGGWRPDARRHGLRRDRAVARRARGGPDAAQRAGLQRAAGADAGERRARRGAPLPRRCRCSGTGSTVSWPTGSSRPTAPTTGGPAGWSPRTRCSSGSGSPSPGCRSGARVPPARAGRGGCRHRPRPRGLRRHRPAGDLPVPGPFRLRRTEAGAVLRLACRWSRAPRSTWRATATTWS